jgi:hypothetical protein
MEKLIKRLKELSTSAKMVYWNGGYIKKVSIGGYDSKMFQCDGIKYKLELCVESKCDNNTNFTPTAPELRISNCREGRYYVGSADIAKFLNITEEQVLDIYAPMIAQSLYTQAEIDNTIESYKGFLTSFRRDFLGEYTKDEERDEKINTILD